MTRMDAKAKPMPSDTERLALREELSAFVLREARLLDERRFEEWVGLFATDGIYWVPASPDQASPADHVSLFYDDKPTLEGRVLRLHHPQIHVQTPPSRTCRLVSDICIDEADAARNRYVTSSSLLMLEYRPGWEQRIFGGRVQHMLRRTQSGFEIVLKRVNLVNCDATFSALAVPF